MAPKTRAQTARLAGFPDVTENGVIHDDRRSVASHQSVQSGATAGSSNGGDVPPIYTIDLSLPPAQRYVEVAQAFKPEIQGLTHLFDEVVESIVPGGISVNTIRRVAKLFLRRLYDREQTEELRGISQATGVEMYLLVCFNTLLDLFMGCSSGGVRTNCADGEIRMLHFRTLDWGMDALRKVVVQLEFVDRPHGRMLGRSITYVGFVGVLTGLRASSRAKEGLSLSLNFRPCHNNSKSRWANLRFYGHHLLVLLGLRSSVSAKLRECILPHSMHKSKEVNRDIKGLPDLAKLTRELPSATTTAAYMIASNGNLATLFEKDRATALTRSSASFIVATNHDLAFETMAEEVLSHPHAQQALALSGMQELVDESVDRKQCMEENWERTVRRFWKKNPAMAESDMYATAENVVEWTKRWPITNDCTHFACVMDPMKGEIIWVRRWLEPVEEPV